MEAIEDGKRNEFMERLNFLSRLQALIDCLVKHKDQIDSCVVALTTNKADVDGRSETRTFYIGSYATNIGLCEILRRRIEDEQADIPYIEG